MPAIKAIEIGENERFGCESMVKRNIGVNIKLDITGNNASKADIKLNTRPNSFGWIILVRYDRMPTIPIELTM